MSSLWPSTISSLNDSLAVLYGSVGKLQAAKSVDISEVIEQVKTAAESSRNLRALVLSELPEAAWQSRAELDALLDEIAKRVEARNIQQQRSRLQGLAAELEQGRIVHRRVVRQNQLTQLRDDAMKELRSEAKVEGAPKTLPGPEADEWIEWACNLKEPEDAAALQALRTSFPHLDEFIANLEPEMWTAKAETPA